MGFSQKNKISYDTNNEEKKTEKDKKEEDAEGIEPVPFFKLFRFADRADKILMVFGIIFACVTGVMQPLNTYVFGLLTGEIVDYAFKITGDLNATYKEELTDKFMDAIIDFTWQNAAIGAVMLLATYFTTVFFNYSSIRQIFKIRNLYLEKALNQDVSWYDVNASGDFASRMSEDITKLEEGLGEKVSMFIHFQVAFVSSLILALVKGWELALICLISFPVTMVSLGVVAILTSKFAKKESEVYAAAGAIAEETLGSIRTVLAFGGQKKEIARYKEYLITAQNNNIRRSFFGGVGFGLLWFFIYASYALAFWYGVKLVLEERYWPEEERVYDAGTMVIVFFSVMMGSMNFGMSSPYIETFGIAKGAAAKIFSVIDSPPVINQSKNNGDKIKDLKGAIEFRDVHFHYPSRTEVEVLQGLNLTIHSGDTVAIVGSSGCGKSTCIQLLQRFYDPQKGAVLVDGHDIRELDLSWYRKTIGVVSQEPVLFGTTIAENIKYGNPEATQEDIERAAQKANAHKFITSLPQGYKTVVGGTGAQLSGGQKQRVAIARALVRNPSIILLDEATSALDTNSESRVQAALDAASTECTTIIVAHRLSTIRNADNIIFLSNGVVTEQGTHEELMNLKADYYKLVMTQINPGFDDEDSKTMALTRMRQRSVSESGEPLDDDLDIADTYILTEDNVDDEEDKEYSLLEIFKVNEPEKYQVFVGIFVSIIMGGTMPAFALLFGEILQVLAHPDDAHVETETNFYCLLFVIAGIVTGLATFLQLFMFGYAGEKLTRRFRIMMFDAMMRQEVGFFDDRNNSVGALCAKLSGEASAVQGATGQRLGSIVQSIATIGLGVGIAMYYEWRLGLVTLSFTPIILIAIYMQGLQMWKETKVQSTAMEKSTKIAVEGVSNIRTISSLGCESNFHRQYVEQLLPHIKERKRNTHSRAVVFGIARSIMFFAFAVAIYYGGVLIRDDGLEFGVVFKVSQALIMGTVSIANALAFAPNIQKGKQAAGSIYKLLNRVPKVRNSDNIQSIKQWKNGDTLYSDVNFSYPTRDSQVLNGLTATVAEGKTVALVGPSGCGKSTVIQLLQRFYDPTSGNVSVEGIDLKDMDLENLRSQLGVVSQEPNLFDRTIEENIAYGDNNRTVSKQEVIEAAKNANIHTFIASLPKGYDTKLGSSSATQLSGGQKQRVAIARALVRNPKVLLLDEATSALDSESEKVVQEALDKAKKGRTCITIAHRLTTIQDADLIYVINNGTVEESGTHKELLENKGMYYRLYNLNNRV